MRQCNGQSQYPGRLLGTLFPHCGFRLAYSGNLAANTRSNNAKTDQTDPSVGTESARRTTRGQLHLQSLQDPVDSGRRPATTAGRGNFAAGQLVGNLAASQSLSMQTQDQLLCLFGHSRSPWFVLGNIGEVFPTAVFGAVKQTVFARHVGEVGGPELTMEIGFGASGRGRITLESFVETLEELSLLVGDRELDEVHRESRPRVCLRL